MIIERFFWQTRNQDEFVALCKSAIERSEHPNGRVFTPVFGDYNEVFVELRFDSRDAAATFWKSLGQFRPGRGIFSKDERLDHQQRSSRNLGSSRAGGRRAGQKICRLENIRCPSRSGQTGRPTAREDAPDF